MRLQQEVDPRNVEENIWHKIINDNISMKWWWIEVDLTSGVFCAVDLFESIRFPSFLFMRPLLIGIINDCCGVNLKGCDIERKFDRWQELGLMEGKRNLLANQNSCKIPEYFRGGRYDLHKMHNFVKSILMWIWLWLHIDSCMYMRKCSEELCNVYLQSQQYLYKYSL